MKWNEQEQLEDLLCEIVGWQSRTGTQGEIDFPYQLQDKLLELNYFQKNRSHIQLHDAGKDRNALTALYMTDVTKKTIVLMSHFDTVHTEEFGTYEDLAFKPRELTELFKERIAQLDEDAQKDVRSEEYLFGRGTMDMKMGLVLHMHLLEQAMTHQWPINLLLVTVPDEEVNSSGMRAAVDGLNDIRSTYELAYELFLNSEPSFSQQSRDDNYYIYSGTIGKIMPSALFYGKETHAGEPLQGITGHYLASYLTKAMELNDAFVEEAYGERTPLPVCLKTYDLKEDYSTQTSHHTAALYNVFVFKRSAAEVMAIYHDVATKAMEECQRDYEAICAREESEPLGTIRVLQYGELETYAIQKLGEKMVQTIRDDVLTRKDLDEREMSIELCDRLLLNCQELAPATVLFFTPPYYPAVNDSEHPFIQDKIQLTQDILEETFAIGAKQVHYFNGISDLSYVNYAEHNDGWKAYKEHTPTWGDVYSIPFEGMQQLQAPVLNVGPFGKDAHQLTERLHKESAFVQTPYVLRKLVESMFE